jgi:hypothetical protein
MIPRLIGCFVIIWLFTLGVTINVELEYKPSTNSLKSVDEFLQDGDGARFVAYASVQKESSFGVPWLIMYSRDILPFRLDIGVSLFALGNDASLVIDELQVSSAAGTTTVIRDQDMSSWEMRPSSLANGLFHVTVQIPNGASAVGDSSVKMKGYYLIDHERVSFEEEIPLIVTRVTRVTFGWQGVANSLL